MKFLIATSPDAGSGKSTSLVALGSLLRRNGRRVGYARIAGVGASEDAAFVSSALRLATAAPVVEPNETALKSLSDAPVDVMLVEAGVETNNLPHFWAAARQLEASHLVVARFVPDTLAARCIDHAQTTGGGAALVLLNAVPEKGRREAERRVAPALEAAGHSILGIIPQDRILLGASVGDLASFLSAEILCAADQLDLPVEAVMIAAMSDEGAEGYFRRINRKVVVAGGDRPDIHLPALATDTSCLVLTDGHDPDPTVLKTADDQGVPLLKVMDGTLPTMERISDALRQIRFRQSHKVGRAVAVYSAAIDRTKLNETLAISTPGAA
jgi:BioD-like phosphotransacetylase family protein